MHTTSKYCGSEHTPRAESNDPTQPKLRASPCRETVLGSAYWDLSRGHSVQSAGESPSLLLLSRPLVPVCSSDQRLPGNTSVLPLHGCCQPFAFHMLKPCSKATDMTDSKQVQLIYLANIWLSLEETCWKNRSQVGCYLWLGPAILHKHWRKLLQRART